MGFRFACPLQEKRWIWLVMVMASGMLSSVAASEPLTSLTRTVWGCVDPNVASSINDPVNPARSDPRWIARTSADGKCITLSSLGQWATLSEDHNGLTYIGHRGTAGPTGSFWVPTTALAVHILPEALAKVRTSVLPKPQATPVPAIQKSQPATQIAPNAGNSPEQPAFIAPVPVAPTVPDGEPFRSTPQRSSSKGGRWGGTVTFLAILVILSIAWIFRRFKRTKGRTTAKPNNPLHPTKVACEVDFRADQGPLSATPQSANASEGSAPKEPAPISTGDRKRTVIDSVDFRIRSESLAHDPAVTEKSTTTTKVTESVDFRIDPSSLSDTPRPAHVGGASGPNQSAPISTDDHKRTVIESVDFRIRSESLAHDPAVTERSTTTTKVRESVDFRIDPSSLSDTPRPAHVGGASGPNQSAPISIDDHKRTTVDSVDFRIRSEFQTHGSEAAASPAILSKGTWHSPGTQVTIGTTMISGGMIYVGKSTGGYGQLDGCFIDPQLPVGSTGAAGPLGYWPSYKDISPDCRKGYLNWLASGKQAADIDIGYVFLYFNGLERRLLVDTPPRDEIQMLVQELERLRSLYASNRSFERHSHCLIDAVELLYDVGSPNGSHFTPNLALPCGDMPLSLKTVIAREVIAGRPLRFGLAAAALFGLREFWSTRRDVLDKGRSPFLTVLQARFDAAFPMGFVVRNRKDSRLELVYRGAIAGFSIDLAARTGLKNLPDPLTLTWTRLFILADTVANDVSPYCKMLAYNPTRAASIAGLINCPPELRDTIAVQDRRWLDGLPLNASVPFGELAKHTIGADSTKWTVRHRRLISEALSVVGYAMEPGPEDMTERMEDSTVVQVFRGTSDSQSRSLIVASAAAMLVAGVVKVNKEVADKIEDFWLSQLPSRLSLPTDQMIRLRARLVWYRTNTGSLSKVKRMLGEATLEEREFCAWSATIAAGVRGNVDNPQIAMLEAIHDALSVPRTALYVGLHAGIGATAAGTDEPVAVSDEAAEVLHLIPRPPAAEPNGPDMDRLARIRADTERVSAMLADIFAENEPVPEIPEQAGQGPLAGLDAEHANLLTKLLASTEWTRQEFDAAATKIGLMPDGAMEAINEWAFDRYGDALVEDGDPFLVNLTLLSKDIPEITAGR